MFQYSQGKHTSQGHKGIPDGHFEEEQGRKGFFGPVSHLIKPQPSTRWTDIQGKLRPHLYDIVEMNKNYGSWQRLFYNSDVYIFNLWVQKAVVSNLEGFRNSEGETLYFCHRGSGCFYTEYGLLNFKPGSYICIPKCITHTLIADEESQFLIIESRSGMYKEPERGMVGKNAFYDLAAIGKPDLDQMKHHIQRIGADIADIQIRHDGEYTRFKYSSNIYDTVGWKGDFFPFSLHIDDLMPMLSHRVHLPPSAHTTFVANGFVVCTFLPRPLESDADALKVPFYHQNIDYDEVLFYHDGDFFSRDNLHPGMVTLHPFGFPHGPHPKAIKNVETKTHTNEVAVMIDTWNRLQIDESLIKVEIPDYWKSWSR